MLVTCLRDNTTFSAIEMPYPNKDRQGTFMSKTGDRYIECPTCARRYFWHDTTEKWSADRDLKILP